MFQGFGGPKIAVILVTITIGNRENPKVSPYMSDINTLLLVNSEN